MEITVNMLKVIRAVAAHRQIDTAEKLGYSLSYISKVERKERKLSKQAVLRVMDAYGLSTERLEQVRVTAKEYEQKGLL
ncbi:helix-turn-helix domain-containing protein [Bacillus alkalicellulosilyticus]|uniref:helix-turn-helix domain-containing protein n=1 Tax=Alkalihalobacterium alkalicellulosilyticum TaxID=1912214 RepID=UPI000997A2BC|nr:helix-turn-helix transcriptional regulator [Bacillus alkalicellulosilyticus]